MITFQSNFEKLIGNNKTIIILFIDVISWEYRNIKMNENNKMQGLFCENKLTLDKL